MIGSEGNQSIVAKDIAMKEEDVAVHIAMKNAGTVLDLAEEEDPTCVEDMVRACMADMAQVWAVPVVIIANSSLKLRS